MSDDAKKEANVDGVLEKDPLLARLAALPRVDLEPDRAERLRRQARAVFLDEVARPAWESRLARAWRDVLEPAVVMAVIAGYLNWAVPMANALLAR